MEVYLYALCVSTLLSVLSIRLAMSMASRLGLIDKPGGHKQHRHVTPFVGGIGVFVALLGVLVLLGINRGLSEISWQALLAGASLMFVTGLVDDIKGLGFKIRFVMQAIAAFVMVQGGVVLSSLGAIIPVGVVELGWLAIPITVFATVGVINALNMIDGIDGLCGMLTFTTLSLLGFVAVLTGQSGMAILVLALAGGVAGFLFFNLRFGSQFRARVFLGDNGTMLLGFLMAWLLIGFSQGGAPAMTPVTALWLFSIPLMDTVGVMLRRIWLGRSPFRPDRYHVHHLFLRSGFTVKDTVLAITLIHLCLGGIGLMTLWLGVPQHVLFMVFLGMFGFFFYLILRPWRFVPALRRLHTSLGLASPESQGVFIGYFPSERATKVRESLSDFSKGCGAHRLRLYRADRFGSAYVYAILELACEDVDVLVEEVKVVMRKLKRQYSHHSDVRVRHYMKRNNANDRRGGEKSIPDNRRITDRRQDRDKMVIYVAEQAEASGNTNCVESIA